MHLPKPSIPAGLGDEHMQGSQAGMGPAQTTEASDGAAGFPCGIARWYPRTSIY